MNQAKVLKRCKELNLEGSCIWALEIMYLPEAEKKVYGCKSHTLAWLPQKTLSILRDTDVRL